MQWLLSTATLFILVLGIAQDCIKMDRFHTKMQGHMQFET